ncbi:hypothetical protein C8Q75DRAFT_420469 [Abortiporus biennis]|nr:hypothetical protein C8Q75DRAFT_420469 [Abortiporus biennis]
MGADERVWRSLGREEIPMSSGILPTLETSSGTQITVSNRKRVTLRQWDDVIYRRLRPQKILSKDWGIGFYTT